ncbi:Unknown protein, partial [Striga hermonthica]
MSDIFLHKIPHPPTNRMDLSPPENYRLYNVKKTLKEGPIGYLRKQRRAPAASPSHLRKRNDSGQQSHEFVAEEDDDPMVTPTSHARHGRHWRMTYVDDSDTHEKELDDLPEEIDSDLDPVEDYDPFETPLMVGAHFNNLHTFSKVRRPHFPLKENPLPRIHLRGFGL